MISHKLKKHHSLFTFLFTLFGEFFAFSRTSVCILSNFPRIGYNEHHITGIMAVRIKTQGGGQ
jgi:hypothetical protein